MSDKSEAAALPTQQHACRLPTLHLLCNLGWNFLSSAQALAMRGGTREVVLRTRLVEVLQTRRYEYKGQWYPLSGAGIEQVLRELCGLGLAEGLLRANERLYTKLSLGITVTELMPDGKKHQPTIAVIDWADPAANAWDVTEGFEVLSANGTHHRAPDVVCLVNGLPLVVIEARRPEGGALREPTVAAGISEHLRNQCVDEVPQLFALAQLLLALSPAEARYGTTGTPRQSWAPWREEEWDDAHLAAIKNRPLPAPVRAALLAGKPQHLADSFAALWTQPMPATAQDRLVVGLLSPLRLLEFLRGFVLFDRKVGKLVARYPQFFGVRALLARLVTFGPDGARQGGVVWHTTGSGKSFTAVFLVKSLVRDVRLAECRVVVVSDRLDLEGLVSRNFNNDGAPGSALALQKAGAKGKASTGRDLARRISYPDGAGERITFSVVQKFNIASKLPECRNDSPNLLVLVDEAHRSQGGEPLARMQRALPKAAFIVFTGTPLHKDEKASGKFGPIVHAYDIQRAVEDQAVAPLLYEARVPEPSGDEPAARRWFDRITAGLDDARRTDLERRFAGRGALAGASGRLELIAWDIATHFSENIKSLNLGLRGQVATESRLDALRYKQALDDTGLVRGAIVLPPPGTREGGGDVDEDATQEVRKWWSQAMQASLERDGLDAQASESQVLAEFAADDGPDLLIVVDELLTGMDEARNAVLYIDKPLKGHSLIQAVARVNRLHDAKRYGLLVDYRGILEELDTSRPDRQALEARTQGGFDIADIEGLYQPLSAQYRRLPALHDRLWSFFLGVADKQDPQQYRQVLFPRFVTDADGQVRDERQTLRDEFSAALIAFGLCLQVALSSRDFPEDAGFGQVAIAQYLRDLKFFWALRQAARHDAQETGDDSAYEALIHRLVDRPGRGQALREPERAYQAHPPGQPEDPSRWPPDRIRHETDLLRARLRKAIAQDLADDPHAQNVFGELLRKAMGKAADHFDEPAKQYALFKAFEVELAARKTPGVPAELSGQPRAQACFGALRLVLGEPAAHRLDEAARAQWLDWARRMDAIVDAAIGENSLNPHDIDAAIRRGILPLLFFAVGLDRARQVADHVVHMTRAGLGRP